MSKKILILEPSLTMQAIFKKCVRKSDCEVGFSTHGIRFLVTLYNSLPDAVLINARSMNPSCTELCRLVKSIARFGAIPIGVYATGDFLFSDEFKAVSGADSFINFDAETVTADIESLCAKKGSALSVPQESDIEKAAITEKIFSMIRNLESLPKIAESFLSLLAQVCELPAALLFVQTEDETLGFYECAENFSDEQTWQDYLLENACTSIRQIAAIKAAAAAEGFTMPEDYQTEYDQTLSSLQEFAASAGFVDPEGNGDVLAYVQDSYGEAATVEDFESYLYDSYYVTAYSDFVYDGLSATEQEISDYYDENAEMYEMYGMARSETPDINVRHILIQPETSEEETGEEEARDAAREEAERIYQLWLDGDATEESFAELAGEYSQDGGSMDAGGLYENVYPGQMVTEFDEWCFDPDRKVGDTGIVETDYGFHIMYFSGLTDHYTWQEAVEGDLLYEKYSRFMEDLTGSCHTVITENVSLPTPAAVQTLAEEAAAQTAAEAEPEPT